MSKEQPKPRYRMRIIPRHNEVACKRASKDYQGTGHSVMYLPSIKCFVFTSKLS